MIDPAAQAIIDIISSRGIPPTHTLTPADARALYRDRRAFTQPEPPEMASVQNITPDGIVPLRVYRPLGSKDGDTLPVLVYLHGGGWTIGDLDTHDVLCRQLSNGAEICVVSVAYRLAPEHRFPAAVDDSWAALQWVAREAAALKVDASRLAVGGDSAGGNLAAVMSLMARDAKQPLIAFQLLIYPATDMRAQAPSHTSNGQGYLLTADSIAYFRGHYISDPADYADWRSSPLLHASHASQPPALVLTAGFDPLCDEGAAYADKLSAAGNRATHVHFARQVHGFILMGRVIDEANAAVALCAAELKRALHA